MVISLDTSAVVSLFVTDANSASARARVSDGDTVAAVSTFAAAELASAISRLVRGRLLSVEGATGLLSEFDGWLTAHAETLEVEPSDHRVAAGFVRRFALGLRAPDALHLAICRRMDLPILTSDRRQAAAAAALGIACDPAGVTGEA